MIHSESIAKLGEALSKAQGAIKGAKKDSTNPHFKSQYADLESTWDACREPLSKNGLSIVQLPYSTEGKIGVTTMLLHESGEWIRGAVDVMMAQITNPQNAGSILTYLRRYSLQGAVGIAPEDDDGNAASGNKTAPVARKVEAAVVDPAGPSPAVETQAPPPPAAVQSVGTSPQVPTEKKDDSTLRHELQELAGIAEEAQLFPTVAAAIYFATSYTTKDGKEAGYKDVLKLKGWQLSKAIAKLTAKLDEKPNSLDEPADDDIPF